MFLSSTRINQFLKTKPQKGTHELARKLSQPGPLESPNIEHASKF
jgi:hypothetical protein